MIDKVIQSTTQQFLDIYDITNDVVIMKDGSTAIIISVDAMNFGLLAEEEQDGIMYAYASLLNSLNYPIQIVIRSQTKDVTGYLLLLREQEEITQNKIMRQRIRAYRDFVANLIHERNVLDKKFYVCIPANSIELGILPPSTVIPGSKPFDISTVEKSVILEKARTILEPKRDHLISQFARIGLFSRQLTSQEIIQMFYISYNPEAAEGQQLADTSNYTTPLVTAGVEGYSMNTLPNQPLGTSPVAAQQVHAPADTAANPTATTPGTTSEITSAPAMPTVPTVNSGSYQPTQMPPRTEPALQPTPEVPAQAEAPAPAIAPDQASTPMATTPTPTLPPTSPTPAVTPATPDASAQAEINQTIGQLQTPAVDAATVVQPPAIPTPPTPTMPAPAGESTSATDTSAATPQSAPNTAPATPNQPLPEI